MNGIVTYTRAYNNKLELMDCTTQPTRKLSTVFLTIWLFEYVYTTKMDTDTQMPTSCNVQLSGVRYYTAMGTTTLVMIRTSS